MDKKIKAFVEGSRKEILDELCGFLRLQSVSADPSHAGDIRAAADFLVNYGREKLGFETRIEETGGHPCVIMHGPEVPGAGRLLIYGHYDVQPAEEPELWKHPPFEPYVEGDVLHGRGTSDDKGQVWAWITAVRALKECGGIPCNISFIIEGEEEIGSRNLAAVLERCAQELACEAAIVSDTSTALKFRPTLHYALRGLVTFEVSLRTGAADVHSGVHGGVSPNAVCEMASLISRLHDDNYHVTVPGFYDGVRPIEDWEKKSLQDLNFDEAEYAATLGTSMHGEQGFSANERRWFRPTLDCNGISGGYEGAGSKTIVPAVCSAKFSARLVADQDPAHIMKCIRAWFESNTPEYAEMTFTEGGLSKPYLLAREGVGAEYFERCRKAIEAGFGCEPLFCRNGGAIGSVAEFTRFLNAPTLLLALGSPDDAIHAPNEKFELRNFFNGICMGARLLQEFGR
ncbi:MAG: M20/M25/M40 family metallo-hydrolase [bacterium]|nr:M20/M25/M40 family metallo-hydrolase [bacterium]